MGFNMDDYVDVAERIRQFYDKYPHGSLQSGAAPEVFLIGDKHFVAYHALAYRAPDDLLPAHGWAWEPVPGPTQFTRDSELMNAETAAWGRAIVALGFETKKIASANEVRNRRADSPTREEKIPQGVLDEIRELGIDLANSGEEDLITELGKLEWRTNPADASKALEKLRKWNEGRVAA